MQSSIHMAVLNKGSLCLLDDPELKSTEPIDPYVYYCYFCLRTVVNIFMKVQEKRKQKKNSIMETALDVWSREDFRKTSLRALSAELNMTKQALYRYFSSKEDLITSINAYINERYIQGNSQLIDQLENTASRKRLILFIEIISEFYLSNRNIVKFDNFWTIRSGQVTVRGSDEQRNEICRLLNIDLRALYLTGMYCQFVFSWDDGCHFNPDRTISEKRAIIRELIQNGLAGENFKLPEKGIRIRKQEEYIQVKERLLRDNLLVSIASAIQDKGLNNVTMEQIAANAGLSKSSLYNYFQNKDELLTKTVNKLVKEYRTFHRELLERYSSFEEKLVAHLELQDAVIPQKPQSLIVLKQYLNREVLRKINPPEDSPDFLSFIQDGINQKKLNPMLSPREYQIIFSSFIFIEKVMFNRKDDSSLIPPVLDWLKLLACGVRN